tara:strand:- start:154 stop:285 length:132 start_codon:yes stop_codon:yes gene_type:complete
MCRNRKKGNAMSLPQPSVIAQDEIARTYERDGFVVPIDVLSQS